MNCYRVTAKCGHVGRRYYYRGEFFVRAESASVAAKLVRGFPRVKHDHKDAILGVDKISEDAFLQGQAAGCQNPYFLCKNVQEQRAFYHELADNIYEEASVVQDDDKRDGRRAYKQLKRKLARKANKHAWHALVGS